MTAWVFRFINNLKAKVKNEKLNLSPVITADEMRQSELQWIRANQHCITSEKLKIFEKNLNLFRDEDGIIRCKGRLENAPLSYDSRNPDMFDKSNKMHTAWGVLYTCAASRGIVLDLSPDTTSNSFIRSFSRFISRRGA